MSRRPAAATYKIVVSPTAHRNLIAIGDAIAVDDPAAALRMVQALRTKITTLKMSPKRCPRAPEDGLDGLEIRHLMHDPYRIIFAIDSATVAILQVRHMRQLPMAGED